MIGTVLRQIQLVTIGGNVLGAGITLTYFHLIDLHMSRMASHYAPSIALLLLLLGTAGLVGTLALGVWRKPLQELAAASDAGRAVSSGLIESARTKALNYPLIAGGVTWLTYLFVGLLFPPTCARLGLMEAPQYVGGFLGYGFVAGIPAGVVQFVTVERLMRRAIPLLFPEGNLRVGRSYLRVKVHHRLLFVFLLVSLLPMSVLGFVAYQNAASLLADPSQAALSHLLIVILFLLGVGALLSVGLSSVVAKSVADPIQEMLEAMEEIGRGRLATRAKVRSTDELGSLAEGFNTMAQSLQATYTELQENNRQLETALGKIQLLERAKEELGRFVPSAVKQLIDEGADSLDGQGEERDVSVLFLDIAGYTQMSEALDQRMVNYLVERYFSAYLDDIYANGGDINETAGDGLMIIFQGDDGHGHAEAAVRTAVAIARKTEDVNQSLGENGYPVRVHIGINSGPASVGLRRFRGLAGERWTYTAAGPTTNVAARIATMAGEGDILIGEETASRVNDVVGLQPLGDFSLKNVAEPVAVYRVVWREEDGFPHGPYSVRSVSDARVDRATMESLR